jgi:hypothetical protein
VDVAEIGAGVGTMATVETAPTRVPVPH